jgi:hypothetical protein
LFVASLLTTMERSIRRVHFPLLMHAARRASPPSLASAQTFCMSQNIATRLLPAVPTIVFPR